MENYLERLTIQIIDNYDELVKFNGLISAFFEKVATQLDKPIFDVVL